MLCFWVAPSVALAGNGPGSNQYIEKVSTIPKITKTGSSKKHKKTSTTTTSAQTTSTSSTLVPPSTTKHHTKRAAKHHKAKHHTTKKPVRSTAKTKQVKKRGSRAISSKRTGGATKLSTGAATGSGGGLGVWLLVILGVVLIAGSAFGILRYRRIR